MTVAEGIFIKDATNGASTGAPVVCNGCKNLLEETNDAVVVSFGNSLWHVDW
jgi:hypothetical protein